MKTSGILNIWYFWHFGSFFQLWEREFGHITYVTKSAPKCQMGTKTPDFWPKCRLSVPSSASTSQPCQTSYWFWESWNESTFPLSEFDETWCAIAGHLWYKTHPISKLQDDFKHGSLGMCIFALIVQVICTLKMGRKLGSMLPQELPRPLKTIQSNSGLLQDHSGPLTTAQERSGPLRTPQDRSGLLKSSYDHSRPLRATQDY